ncbi:MAG: universal stress protein, partial [Cyanobacteria bacterium P01_H01_bin.15]
MLSKILYADSGSGQTREMLKVLLDLPAFQRASLTVLHVVPPQITTQAVAERWEEGGQLIADVVKDLNLEPHKISTVLRQGDPKDVVCEVADEINTDLIIMGSRNLKRLEAILLNSVSQYVFQLTEHPMLLVKDDIYVKRIKRVMVALDKSEAAQYSLTVACDLFRDNPDVELFLTPVNTDLDTEFLPLSK